MGENIFQATTLPLPSMRDPRLSLGITDARRTWGSFRYITRLAPHGKHILTT